LPGGDLSLLLGREGDAPWPPSAAAPGVRGDVLPLEDLFIEVAE
jgi:hypothetical protein